LKERGDDLKRPDPAVDGHRTDGVCTHLDDSVVELALSLYAAQASALEAAAWRRGLSRGQMLRQLAQEFLDQSELAGAVAAASGSVQMSEMEDKPCYVDFSSVQARKETRGA